MIQSRLWQMFDSDHLKWLVASITVFCILAISLARWAIWTGVAIVALFIFLGAAYFVKFGGRAKYSTRTTFQITGLVACLIGLVMQGGPWREVHRFSGYEVNLAISRDGLLVAVSQGTSIEIRENRTGRVVQMIKMPAMEAAKRKGQRWTFQMKFSNNGESLMTVGWRQFPCLLEIDTGGVLRSLPTVSGGDLAAKAERLVAISTGDSTRSDLIEVYDYELDLPLFSLESSASFRTISSSGSHLLIGNGDLIELWNVDEQILVGKIPMPQIRGGLFFARFSDDGKRLAIPTSKGAAVWDTATCTKLRDWSPASFSHLTALEWNPDGSRLIASYIETIPPTSPSARNAIEHCYLLDQDLETIAALFGTSPTFSPFGDRIATVWGGVCISDGENGNLLTVLSDSCASESPFGISRSLLFSPDGNWLLHNGTPTVHRRLRSEYWYSTFQLPAFWGLALFLTSLIMELLASILASRLQSELT